jgi:hypothetical protein
MAHFAEINGDNIVLRVIAWDDNDVRGNGGDYSTEVEEYIGAKMGGTWKQTSYTGRERKNYAGPGYTWSSDNDGFIEPKDDWRDSWTLNTDTCRYDPPHACPFGDVLLTGVTWKDSDDATIKQEHRCFWNDSAGRWESKLYNEGGSLKSEHYWNNNDSQWEDK